MEQSHEELYKSKSNNTKIEEDRKIFNETRNRFSKEKVKKIRREFQFLELERKNSLTEQEKQDKKHYIKNLKRLKSF